MNLRFCGLLASAALIAGSASAAWAAPVPVSVDMPALRAIQTYSLDEKADDQVFALVAGVAGGQEIATRLPDADKTWSANPKKQAVAEAAPVNLWKGTLNDGEYAVILVSVFQGEGKDAALLKKYSDAITAAEKKAPEIAKKTLTDEDFKALSGDFVKKEFKNGDLVTNERAVITKIKDMFSRDKNTDHFGGLFNVVVWNDGTMLHKRVVPVGLTFGEQYSVDVKIYTKLKFTRDNVFVKDDKGEWSTEQLSPISDEETTVHVKMLETELVKGADGNPTKKTTDYLTDVMVKAGDQPTKWKLEGEVTGVDDIHRYWEFAD